MSTDEWKSVEFYQFVSTHPDRMFHEGLKEQLGHTGPYVSESQLINTYYTHTIVRCIPVLDFLNSRYLELGQIVPDADSLLNFMNQLFKFHPNPIAFAYQTLMYYNKRENQSALGGANLNQSLHHNQTELIYKAKKKRIFSIIAGKDSLSVNTIDFLLFFLNQSKPIRSQLAFHASISAVSEINGSKHGYLI